MLQNFEDYDENLPTPASVQVDEEEDANTSISASG